MKKPIIYSIVVTHNRINFLKKCLSSIKKQTYPVKKIIVVDNCSTDGTRDYLKKLYKKDKTFQIIFNKDDLGMANAINLALMTIMAEDWDYVWITDDDDFLEKIALKLILKYSNKKTITEPIIMPLKKEEFLYQNFDSDGFVKDSK